jgi:hypothetical protein
MPDEMPDEMRDELGGGEAACLLARVCLSCGRFQEDASASRCRYCGAPTRGGPADRDRDVLGRARNARPRDALGRPLPYGTKGVERQPEGISRSPAEALEEAQRLLDTGLPFHAHEVLEDAWKATDGPEREVWKGLAQLAVGVTHAARGNPTGASALLRRGARNISAHAQRPPHGIDVSRLVRWAHEVADELDTVAAGEARQLTPPRLRDEH